jgi:CheY-like chemotaxis protein
MLDADKPIAAVSTRKRRVLVAEDDDEMRRLLVETMRELGYEVGAVSNGAALLIELARGDDFHYRDVDLVVADVRMPICSGLRALQAVREANAAVPFLFLTAFGDEAIHAQAARLGAAILDKPVSLKRLRETVVTLVEKTRAG